MLRALEASPSSEAWLRILALVDDPFLWLGEIAGMRRRRSTLLGAARGRVVEIGAGTGLNIAHYPDGIAELVLIEPDPAMRGRLALRLQRYARVARIVDAPAERLPLADASVDTVVSTLVLCTVNDPECALRGSHACSARMGSCCSSNTCARARGSSRRARTTCSDRGAAMQAAAVATVRRWS
jgi:SAM-dependent methyltransferase